jgi:hypothetical protein
MPDDHLLPLRLVRRDGQAWDQYPTDRTCQLSHHQQANLEHSRQENEEAASHPQDPRILTSHSQDSASKSWMSSSLFCTFFLIYSHSKPVPFTISLQQAVLRVTPYPCFQAFLYVTDVSDMFVMYEKYLRL